MKSSEFVLMMDRLNKMKAENGLPEITILTLQVLMQIDACPGITSRQLQEVLGKSDSSLTRQFQVLSGGERKVKAPGYGLIRQEVNADDMRSRNLYLTREGEEFFNWLDSLSKKPPKK